MLFLNAFTLALLVLTCTNMNIPNTGTPGSKSNYPRLTSQDLLDCSRRHAILEAKNLKISLHFDL